jgi:hypothetical protein
LLGGAKAERSVKKLCVGKDIFQKNIHTHAFFVVCTFFLNSFETKKKMPWSNPVLMNHSSRKELGWMCRYEGGLNGWATWRNVFDEYTLCMEYARFDLRNLGPTTNWIDVIGRLYWKLVPFSFHYQLIPIFVTRSMLQSIYELGTKRTQEAKQRENQSKQILDSERTLERIKRVLESRPNETEFVFAYLCWTKDFKVRRYHVYFETPGRFWPNPLGLIGVHLEYVMIQKEGANETYFSGHETKAKINDDLKQKGKVCFVKLMKENLSDEDRLISDERYKKGSAYWYSRHTCWHYGYPL